MNGRSVRNAWMILLLSAAAGAGQGALVGDNEPLLRLEAGGPTTLVTALAFGPDGGTLYEGGWDKVVRVWTRDPRTGAFAIDPRAAYRVPLGPGLDGVINAVALSTGPTAPSFSMPRRVASPCFPGTTPSSTLAPAAPRIPISTAT